MVASPTSHPHLTVVPTIPEPHTPQAPSPATQATLSPKPDLFLDDIPDEPEKKTKMPPLPDIDLGGSAFPGFLGDHQIDTQYTAQPHWLSDAKGEPFTFRLNAGLSRLVTILVESNATPYRTKSDFFRDAAFYLALAVRNLINSQDQRLDSLLQEAELRSHSDYEAALQQELIEFEHTLSDAVVGCIERGALGEACRKIREFQDRVKAIPLPHRRLAHQTVMDDSLLFKVVLQLGAQHGVDVPSPAATPIRAI